ncbi:putative EAL-domain containing protein YkuI [Zhongshania aliphaticivorans]|uniref:Putative EAL-domain containing protein YkuI n=1 Tax=Zhongshania aliphaticivorans TaxID=1470434 RepID=A0A5S9QP59_9GAMM|nr:EAL domain-containing protein [Zhongshania aliphaticivorans]CAA0087506.1 putative EAL-domain containing protein YkuI [Zhongshania aliphaticivorans]CAA0115017.1 putative EAL-domain containing protein YkuI [Zhongshania aliphaticivorans]CAA0119821.1 putative EAL-domain containing protein YkuI [Zhongshania aliphaticivorans]
MKYFPYFQPIIDINKMSIVGYEALGRVRADNGDAVSVGAMFGDASFNRRDLLAMDRSVREQAISYFSKSPQDVFLSLNLSPEWMDYIADSVPVPTLDMVEKWGVEPSRVVIEFVEGAGDNDNMQRLLARYRAAGMRVAIDDFGSGFSHLDRIIALEPDILKLDMNLFKRAMAGGVSQEVVQSIAYLARRTGSKLLCEGVETEQEFYYALECGARYMQGYFFWPALPEFIDVDSPKELVRPLLASFVNQNVDNEKQRIQYMTNMESYFLSVQAAVNGRSLEYAALAEAPAGLLRVFLCDDCGEQISPNYEVVNQTDGRVWQQDHVDLGSNWSMRPYFYQALAAKQLQQNTHIASSPYRDIRTGYLCQTIAMFLTENRMLFADIKCLDEAN